MINQSTLGFLTQFKDLKLNEYFALPTTMNKLVIPKVTCVPIVKTIKQAITSHIELSTNGLSIDVDQSIVYEFLCLNSKLQQFSRNMASIMPKAKPANPQQQQQQPTAPSTTSIEFSLKFRSDFAKCNLYTTNAVNIQSNTIITSASMVYPPDMLDRSKNALSGSYHKCDTLVIPPVSIALQHQNLEQSSTEISIVVESSLLRVSPLTVNYLRDTILAARNATQTAPAPATKPSQTQQPTTTVTTPSSLTPVIKLVIHLDKTVLEMPSNIHAEVVCRAELGPVHYVLSTFAKKYKNNTVTSYNSTVDITKMAVKVCTIYLHNTYIIFRYLILCLNRLVYSLKS